MRVIGDANKSIVAAGTLVGALAALVTAVALLLPGSSNPAVLEASFEEAKVEPNVLHEQYEDLSRTTASTGDGSQAQRAGYRLVADTALASASASARPAIGVLAAVSDGSTATSASSSTAASNAQEEAALKEEEKVKKELQLQEVQELKEEARQKEQAKLDEEKVLREQAKQKEEVGRGEEEQLKGTRKAKAEEATAEAKAATAMQQAVAA